MQKVPSICPICGNDLYVETVTCKKCNTSIENRFEFSVFEKLNREQTDFVLTFVKCEGSIKDMEKELKVSYPTVKARLAEIKKVLNVSDGKVGFTQNEVLDMLEKGEITVEQAAEMLSKI